MSDGLHGGGLKPEDLESGEKSTGPSGFLLSALNRFRYVVVFIAVLGVVGLLLLVFKDVLFRGGTETILGARSFVGIVAVVAVLLFAVSLDSRLKSRVLVERAERLSALARKLYQDVDELTDIKRTLTKSGRKAERINDEKNQFIKIIGDEIRSHCQTVLSRISQLRDEVNLSPSTTTLVAELVETGHQLDQKGRRLAEASLSIAETSDSGINNFDLNFLVHRLADVYRTAAKRKNIGFELRVPENLPPAVHGDALHLRVELANLLDNAVKFTDAGCVTFSLTGPADDHYRISIEDTGPGIPTEGIEALFDPFVQGPGAALRGGAGLGLAVARREAALLGADITCSSTLGEGSCFSIDLHLPEVSPSGSGAST